MIGLDTNVVIRYLVQDDAKQASAATQNVDFRNALIALTASGAGCKRIVTFDKEAAKLGGFEMLG